ncbi:MAG TPA: MMPL family transporter, partial [Phycisphaerae bacterium]|nr:MMPL family transporter [Phycisphaerae bacterium]
ILASGGTTICGLSMMLLAELVPSQNAGKFLAPVLAVSLMAALTLAPAMARLMGRGLFWPMGLRHHANLGERFVWPVMASLVTRRPRTVLLVGLLLLGIPAVLAIRLTPRFDSLSELPAGSPSDRGFKLLNAHFPVGQLFSSQLIFEFDALPDEQALSRVSREVTDRLRQLPGVADVYSLSEPLGQSAVGSALLDAVVARMGRRFYVSDALHVLRFEILIEPAPFSAEAMALIEQSRSVAGEYIAGMGDTLGPARPLVAGFTPYIIDVRAISGSDQARVMSLATVVIGLVVLALVRDLPLTLFMLLATWLTYGATLTFSDFFFTQVLHQGGLDWKVRLIVFVIVVAVGQDYNLFLVSRLLHELRDRDERDATRRAVITTGSVISSCGIIMAATLGSLWVGGLSLLRQVGFTLALGVLLDTFLVRPLLVPSFFLAAGRARRHRPCLSAGRGSNVHEAEADLE